MRGARAAFAWLALLAAASCGEARGTLVTTGATPVFRPAPGASWQVQLTGALDTSLDVAIYDVDLFDTTAAQLDALRSAGRRVICYVSVGTYEPWRADASSFPAAAQGDALAGFPDERWLDTRDATVRTLMAARLDLAAQKKCDGVDLSNLSPEGATTGFGATTAEAEAYGRFLASAAHARGLGAGLGGGDDVAGALAGDFEWALTEGCARRRDLRGLRGLRGGGEGRVRRGVRRGHRRADDLPGGPAGRPRRPHQEPVVRRLSRRLPLTRTAAGFLLWRDYFFAPGATKGPRRALARRHNPS